MNRNEKFRACFLVVKPPPLKEAPSDIERVLDALPINIKGKRLGFPAVTICALDP